MLWVVFFFTEMLRDRAISSKFLRRRSTRWFLADIKIFDFFQFLAAILNFCGKQKIANILKTVRDRAISIEFWIRRMVQDALKHISKFSIFSIFGAILNFCGKQKIANISKTVRDRAISIEFFTRRVVKECKYTIWKNFTIFGGHLGFLREINNRKYLVNRKR